MHKKIIVISIILLFVGMCFQPQFSIALPSSLEKSNSISNRQNCNRTLITEYGNQRVIEVDSSGSIVWLIPGLNLPTDAERLPNGNTLIAQYGNGRVIEVDENGDVVWEITGLHKPMDAERLQNGNTLVVQATTGSRITNFNGSVIEVDSEGNEVWIKANLSSPIDAERLENGNTLIVEYLGGRIIEVDISGNIVREIDGLDKPMDVEILDTGVLITEYLSGRVFGGGWEITGLDGPVDAEPLDNGNILIVELDGGRIIEVNSSGDIVWELIGFLPFDAERMNNRPPEAPKITGPGSVPSESMKLIVKNPANYPPGKPIEFRLEAIDPDGDDIRYYIDWGDGSIDITGFYPSGVEVKVNHTYNSQGAYVVAALAEDICGLRGPVGTISIPIWSISKENNNKIKSIEDYEEIITFIDGICDAVTCKGIYIKRDVTFQAGENTGLEISGFYRPWIYFKEINVVYIHAPIYIGVIFSYPPDGMPSRIWGIAIGNIEWS